MRFSNRDQMLVLYVDLLSKPVCVSCTKAICISNSLNSRDFLFTPFVEVFNLSVPLNCDSLYFPTSSCWLDLSTNVFFFVSF
jgi:hypothetical protein